MRVIANPLKWHYYFKMLLLVNKLVVEEMIDC
jgi:hypothetical protein